MPTFSYQAVRSGVRRPIHGVIEAPSAETAVEALKSQGLHPTQLSPGTLRKRVRWSFALPYAGAAAGDTAAGASAPQFKQVRWLNWGAPRTMKPRVVAM